LRNSIQELGPDPTTAKNFTPLTSPAQTIGFTSDGRLQGTLRIFCFPCGVPCRPYDRTCSGAKNRTRYNVTHGQEPYVAAGRTPLSKACGWANTFFAHTTLDDFGVDTPTHVSTPNARDGGRCPCNTRRPFSPAPSAGSRIPMLIVRRRSPQAGESTTNWHSQPVIGKTGDRPAPVLPQSVISRRRGHIPRRWRPRSTPFAGFYPGSARPWASAIVHRPAPISYPFRYNRLDHWRGPNASAAAAAGSDGRCTISAPDDAWGARKGRRNCRLDCKLVGVGSFVAVSPIRLYGSNVLQCEDLRINLLQTPSREPKQQARYALFFPPVRPACIDPAIRPNVDEAGGAFLEPGTGSRRCLIPITRAPAGNLPHA